MQIKSPDTESGLWSSELFEKASLFVAEPRHELSFYQPLKFSKELLIQFFEWHFSCKQAIVAPFANDLADRWFIDINRSAWRAQKNGKLKMPS